MTENEVEKHVLFDVDDDTEYITKYDLKIYDYENKKYINNELHKFEVQMISFMTNKLENISLEISGIKSLMIQMLFGMIGSFFILFISAIFLGVI